ncbi:hypothetical protein BDV28DRAFT_145281 [Aspergillus coremiiformis]|uniref:Uncharacterized protein n=1 Tax=Aspergillus coremiiformis TaxID=138285 RepID=A0A5N6ZHK9_9EURO|nr:hypothetical protein BDV28DRAFT_145281 [Aspergillus coremiiformis]
MVKITLRALALLTILASTTTANLDSENTKRGRTPCIKDKAYCGFTLETGGPYLQQMQGLLKDAGLELSATHQHDSLFQCGSDAPFMMVQISLSLLAILAILAPLAAGEDGTKCTPDAKYCGNVLRYKMGMGKEVITALKAATEPHDDWNQKLSLFRCNLDGETLSFIAFCGEGHCAPPDPKTNNTCG